MDNPQAISEVTEAELGWLAGIIDGEGTVIVFLQMDRGKMVGAHPQVIVGNTEKVMIDRIAEIVGRLGIGIYVTHREPKSVNGVSGTAKSKYKTLHVASIVGFKRAGKLLQIIVPYLVTSKRERGEMILRYIETRSKRLYPNGVRQWAGRAKFTVEDLVMIRDIMATTKTKHFAAIEERLRDLTRTQESSLLDDIVRATSESGGGPTRDGPAPVGSVG
jgi:hypothetical protein